MKNIINISEFNEIVKGVKAMKADLVLVYNDLLLGTDTTLSCLKMYKMPFPISTSGFTIITKELSSKFFSNIIDTNIVIDTDENKIYCPNHKSYADEAKPMIDTMISNKILDIYYRTMDGISRSNLISFGNINDDESFQFYKSIRSGDGAIPYIPSSEYTMYLYSGAIPLNKDDKVSLEVYDSGPTFISKFTVWKKKLYPIDIYFRFVKMK